MERKDLDYFINELNDSLKQSAEKFKSTSVHNTIVFFGSHKICTVDDAQDAMKNVEILFDKSRRRTEKQWETLDEASNCIYMSRYYQAAEELAYKLATWSKKFKRKENQYVLCSGGGPGIMQATNKGAHRAGAQSIGLSINIPQEQGKNIFITPELHFEFQHFIIRKFWFFFYARAIVAFPGGLGTLDEVFEILTMIKTGKSAFKLPVILFGSDYWKETVNFESMVRYSTIDREDLDLIYYVDSVDEAFKFITENIRKNSEFQEA